MLAGVRMSVEDRSPFAVERPGDSLGFRLWLVTAVWQRAMAAALEPHGLTQVQFVLLAGLWWLTRQGDEITQAALARHARLDAMMTSQVLRGLERRGLVRRAAHSRDGRARRLSLTKKARALLPGAGSAVETADAAFFHGTTAEHHAALDGLLRSLAD